MESVTEINESLQQNGEPEVKEEPMSDGEDEMILPDNLDIADVDPLQIDDIKQEEEPERVSHNSGNTGYEAWCRNRKQELQDKFPELSHLKILKQVNREWEKLSDKVKEIWNNIVITPQPAQSITPVKSRRQSSRPRKPKEFKDIPDTSNLKKKSTRPFKRQSLTFTLYPSNYEPPKELEIPKIQEDTQEEQNKQEKRRKPLLRSTGYSLWAKEVGVVLRQECPLMTFSEISKHVSKMWRELPNLEKYNFRRRAKRINEKIAKDLLSKKEDKEKEKEDDNDEVDNDDTVTRVSSKGRILAKSKKLLNFCAFEEKHKINFRKIKEEQSSVVSNEKTEEAKQVKEQDPICSSATEKRKRIKRLKSP